MLLGPQIASSRAWDKIGDHLKVGQDERFAVPFKAGGLYHVGKVIPTPEKDLRGKSATAFHIRIDVKDTGIRVVPGSHIGILYESNAEEVHKTLLAFADGDANKAEVGGIILIIHPMLQCSLMLLSSSVRPIRFLERNAW